MKKELFVVLFSNPASGGDAVYSYSFSLREAIILTLAERIHAGKSTAIMAAYECVGEDKPNSRLIDDPNWRKLVVPTSLALEHATTFSR